MKVTLTIEHPSEIPQAGGILADLWRFLPAGVQLESESPIAGACHKARGIKRQVLEQIGRPDALDGKRRDMREGL